MGECRPELRYLACRENCQRLGWQKRVSKDSSWTKSVKSWLINVMSRAASWPFDHPFVKLIERVPSLRGMSLHFDLAVVALCCAGTSVTWLLAVGEFGVLKRHWSQPSTGWWFQHFLFSPLGEMIQFDFRTFLRWVGSTTSVCPHLLVTRWHGTWDFSQNRQDASTLWKADVL